VSADLRAALETGLAGRYAIERELGRGGMAMVYLARDLRHDRPVALKVLHPELGAALGGDRFQREIRLAARLQHPHILTVHDSGEIASASGPPLLWFTMPFVDGETLRARLQRERQLSVEEALTIAREAADALDYAHQQGIVHRDIKPENILLTARHALVADFGVARALAGAEQGLTETGMTLGTPAYMSPEQASGERSIDGRTDIYSLGSVLYEMLAGQPPFSGASAQAIIAKRFTETAPPVRRSRESVSPEIDAALTRALARLPADRFATAGEFAKALTVQATSPAVPTALAPDRPSATTPPVGAVLSSERQAAAVSTMAGHHRFRVPAWLAFVLGLLVTASMGMLIWQRSHRAGEPAVAGPKRLAVVPFENLGAPEDEYFADGMTDEVRGKLASVSGLQVIANRSVAEYKRSTKSYQQIGQELGVQYLLIGKVRWEKQAGAQSRVRVSPELIDVSSSSTKWQQPFDAALTDVFQVQGEIAGKVARALDVALGEHERERIEVRPTQNLAAYDAFLRGEEASDRMSTTDPPALSRAASAYEQAVALDSTFALAWARLSQARSNIYGNGVITAAGIEQARRAAERALALAPDRPEGRLALGDYYTQVLGDYPKALEQYTQGQRADPTNAELLTSAALAEQAVGRWEAALEHLQRAQSIDPRSASTARRLAVTLLWLRRYPEAIAPSDRGLALAPTNLSILENKALISLAQGDLAGARDVLHSAPREVDPTALVAFVGTYWDLVWALDDDQQQLLLRLTPSAFSDDRFNWAHCLAQTYALRGNVARAQAYADSARAAAESTLQATPQDPSRRMLMGLALAYMGRKSDAVREGERAAAMLPMEKDAYTGPYLQHQLARIYVRVGQPEKALDILERLLKVPYYVSPGFLRIDPEWKPLHDNPRFQRLVQSG
jgi:serine/threonine protein kinase/tetratricopeptide (TPR) repeat protein